MRREKLYETESLKGLERKLAKYETKLAGFVSIIELVDFMTDALMSFQAVLSDAYEYLYLITLQLKNVVEKDENML